MDDIRALRLYEEKFGREATIKLVDSLTNAPLTFSEYPTDPQFLPTLRETIAKAFA